MPLRSTTDVKDLNVRLQGKPAMAKDQTAISAIQQVNITFCVVRGSNAIKKHSRCQRSECEITRQTSYG